MFKKEGKEIEDFGNKKNQIEQGTKITGNIETHGNIRIDGELKGDLISKSKVVLGPSCIVEGNITALNAEIEGTVNGSIVIDELLVLKDTAAVNGNISASKLHTAPGALINGQIKMGAVVKDLANDKKDNKAEKAS